VVGRGGGYFAGGALPDEERAAQGVPRVVVLPTAQEQRDQMSEFADRVNIRG